ncbi:MAG: DUF2478 domain-containing protein [Xanthomonadales bacterium]|nr:DUF2478 domain-containing protein [Xanthomonadales bacterium]
MSSSDIRAAAVVFRRDEHDRRALAEFARSLQSAGFRLGGIVQEAFYDEQGRRLGIDSVDLATGDRVTINKPGLDPLKGGCSLDGDALMDSGLPLRRALGDRPQLVVIEKYGEQEQAGAGLADDIIAVIAEGLATLVLVPAEALDDWRELTAGTVPELPCEAGTLRRWWESGRAA